MDSPSAYCASLGKRGAGDPEASADRGAARTGVLVGSHVSRAGAREAAPGDADPALRRGSRRRGVRRVGRVDRLELTVRSKSASRKKIAGPSAGDAGRAGRRRTACRCSCRGVGCR